MDSAQEQLEELLASHRGIDHIRVKRRGRSLTLYSDSDYGADLHAKLTAIGRHRWALSLPRHTGRWEKTPFVGSMQEIIETLTQMLGFHLAPRG